MAIRKTLALGIMCLVATMAYTQTDEELTWDAELDTTEDSRYLLKNEMSDSLYQTIKVRQVRFEERSILTTEDAISLGKEFFAKEYGSDYHLDTRRYLAHMVKGYWIVKGMQPLGNTGGCLVVIFDSASGDVLSTLVWK